MKDEKELIEKTRVFFSKHWVQSNLTDSPPEWKRWCDFRGTVPNYNLGGCYALFRDNSLVYVGVGASKGHGLYKEHGISKRLLSHVIQKDMNRGKDWYKPRDKWQGITMIQTIGFNRDTVYMSLALESFLIRNLNNILLENARV